MGFYLGILMKSPPPSGGGTEVDDLTKGFSKEHFTQNIRQRNGGGQGDPDPLISNQ